MPHHVRSGSHTLCDIEVNGSEWTMADTAVSEADAPSSMDLVTCEQCLRRFFQTIPVSQAVAEMGIDESLTESLDRWGAEGNEDGPEMESMSDGPSEDHGPQTPRSGSRGVLLQLDMPPQLREVLDQLQEVAQDIINRDRVDFGALHQENEELRKANEELRDQISVLTLAVAHLMTKREHPRAELSPEAKEWARVIQEALRQGVRVRPTIQPHGKGQWKFDIEPEKPLDEPPSSIWERLGEDD